MFNLNIRTAAETRLRTMKRQEFWKNQRGLNYQDCFWYKSYVVNVNEAAAHYAEGTAEGKLFRTRFRLPFELYLQLLKAVKEADVTFG